MAYLVGLDAGHGMNTPGKRTPALKEDIVVKGKVVKKKGSVIHENEWNRAVAEYCSAALKRCGINTFFTADMTGKTDTALSTRASRANAKGCNLLVSFHYNAYGGCSSFLNKKGGLLILRTKNCSNKSIALGKAICKHLEADISTYKYSYGVCRDVDISGFTLAILRQTTMPAVLVEYGFMDVWHEAKLMVDPEHQKKCGEATAKGICEVLGVKYKPEPVKKVTHETTKLLCQIQTLDSLNIRKIADWDAPPVTTVEKGQYLDVIGIVDAKNGKTKMYKLESGLYITASERFVKKV